jgi:hypothetical protein
MALVLRSPTSPSPEPFSWNVPSPPAPLTDGVGLPEAPTTWLSSKDMKMYGSDPMKNDGGVFKCKDCKKPILRSAVGEHVGASHREYSKHGEVNRRTENCTKIRKQGNKTLETDGMYRSSSIRVPLIVPQQRRAARSARPRTSLTIHPRPRRRRPHPRSPKAVSKALSTSRSSAASSMTRVCHVHARSRASRTRWARSAR